MLNADLMGRFESQYVSAYLTLARGHGKDWRASSKTGDSYKQAARLSAQSTTGGTSGNVWLALCWLKKKGINQTYSAILYGTVDLCSA